MLNQKLYLSILSHFGGWNRVRTKQIRQALPGIGNRVRGNYLDKTLSDLFLINLNAVCTH